MFLIRLCLIAAFAVFVTACTSALIAERPPITVPKGLVQPQVELAILAAASKKPVSPQAYDHTYFLGVGDIYSTMLWQDYISSPAPSGWYPESHGDGVINAGFTSRNHYLEVAIHYDTQTVRTEIISSRNLDQTTTTIHKKVPIWIDQLEDRIRQELGKFAFSSGVAGQ